MLKRLSASTILASAIVFGGGMAAQAFELTLKGDSEFKYETWSDDVDNTGGNNDSKTSNVSHLIVNADAVSDSGLSYGTWFRIESDTGNGDGKLDEDGHHLYVSGGFGKLQLGSNGSAGGTYYADVFDEVTNDEGNTGLGLPSFGYGTDAKTGDEVITYHSPDLSGFKGGISFVDAGSESKADGREIGLQYTASLMDGSLTLKYASAQYDSDSVSPTAASDEYSATSFGGNVKMGAFGLYVSRNTIEEESAKQADKGTKTKEVTNTGFAASYQASDALKLTLSMVSSEDDVDKAEADATAFSADYTIAPGLSSGLTYTNWEGSDGTGTEGGEKGNDQSGTYTVLYMKVAF